ncbi:MAG TPA: hypothetical protein PLV42_11070 [bacterium]|nr:hypothetical protein [bacterium]
MKFMPLFIIMATLLVLAACDNNVTTISDLKTDNIAAGDTDTTGTDTPVTTDNDTPVGTDSDIPVGNDTEPNDNTIITDDIVTDDTIPDDATETEPVDDEVVIPDEDNTVSTRCVDNGALCITTQDQQCYGGWIALSQFTCDGGGEICCDPIVVEITGPAPVPAELKNIAAIIPASATQGGTGTPAITSDIGPLSLAVIGLLENNANGCNEYQTKLNGEIALVERGTCQFSQKITNAANAGAGAVIIYNNAQGVLEMQADGAIPTVGITQADGEAIITFTQSNPTITAAIRAQ